MIMVRYRNVLLALFLVFFTVGCATKGIMGGSDYIRWRDLSEGKKEAGEKKLPILVDFFMGKGCPRCEKLVDTVYANPEFAEKINRHFIPVRINRNFTLTTEELNLDKKLGSNGECVLTFLDADGNIVTDENGEQIKSMAILTEESFAAHVDRALSRVKSK